MKKILKKEEKKEIIKILNENRLTQTKIAEMFSVSKMTVSNIYKKMNKKDLYFIVNNGSKNFGRPLKYKKGKKVVSIRLTDLEKKAILEDFGTIQQFIEESLVDYFMSEPIEKNRTLGQIIYRGVDDD